MRAIAEYVHLHLFDIGLTVTEVKREAGAYEYNLTCRFAWHTGHLSIKAYIDTHRLEMGKRLLRYDELRIGEITLAVGYNSHSAFSMAFRRHEGCTPSEYRKMLRKS